MKETNGNAAFPLCTEPLQQLFERAEEEETDISRFSFINDIVVHLKLHTITVSDCTFTKCTFHDFLAERIYFHHVTFENCDLSGATFSEGCLRSVTFRNCKLAGTNFVECTLDTMMVKDSFAEYANLNYCKITHWQAAASTFCHASITDCTAKGMAFNDCNLQQAEFLHTPLQKVDLTTNQIEGLVLSGPELRGAIVTPMQACDLARYLGLIIQ